MTRHAGKEISVMTSVTELNLYDLPIGEQLFANDPNPHMLAARQQHGWLAKSAFGYVITEFNAVNDILMCDDKLKTPSEHVVEIMGGEGTNWARFQRECLIARDGAEHVRIRSAVNKAFLPKAVNTYRQRIQDVVVDLLDEWVPKGRFDFENFASRFPVAITFGLLGIPRDRIDDVKYWLEMLGQSYSLDRSIFAQIEVSFNRLWDFAEQRVQLRKSEGNTGEVDLLDALIEAETTGKITAVERNDLILFLFAGGYDTSKNQLGHIINFMLDRPELWERCARERSFCEEVVAETFRHSGVSTSYRNVATEMDYRGVTFPVGTMLIFPLGIVGRYSGPFQNPIMFDPERTEAKRNTVFGRGMHICLGQFLAKLQIVEGLHLIAQRLQHPRRDGDILWRLFPGVWGPKQLPIAFDPA
jgi:cytochrome P450